MRFDYIRAMAYEDEILVSWVELHRDLCTAGRGAATGGGRAASGPAPEAA